MLLNSQLYCGIAPIDPERRSGHEACHVRRQEQGGLRDLGRVCDSLLPTKLLV
jgi:hypothetical protein